MEASDQGFQSIILVWIELQIHVYHRIHLVCHLSATTGHYGTYSFNRFMW